MSSGLKSGMLMLLEFCASEAFGRGGSVWIVGRARKGAKQNDLGSELVFSRSESSSPRRERKKSSKKKKHRYEVGVRGVI